MKRTKKSQKKTKFLLILIVLTAILSITATYAWFSSQREVEISTMRLNVEVAENLEISLDGETWANSIVIDNLRQLYGTYKGVSNTHTIYQASETDNSNYVPTELLPVSTTGSVANGVLQFMKGEVKNGEVSATACSETDIAVTVTPDNPETEEVDESKREAKSVASKETNNNKHPYLVFDMYLKNISSQAAGDPLRIATDSKVWVDSTATDPDIAGVGVTGTGLENCIRVGFVPYSNTMDPTTATGENVRALTDGATGKVAIWEPNDKEHITEVINNSGRNVTANTTIATFGVKFDASMDGSTETQNIDGVEVVTKKELKIDNWESTTDTKLGEQKTVKPAYNTTTGTTSPVALITTAEGTATGATHSTVTDMTNAIKLGMNKITKIRCYIWLEGQDVDCINTASMGNMVQINLRLDKNQVTNATLPTYSGSGVAEPGND